MGGVGGGSVVVAEGSSLSDLNLFSVYAQQLPCSEPMLFKLTSFFSIYLPLFSFLYTFFRPCLYVSHFHYFLFLY